MSLSSQKRPRGLPAQNWAAILVLLFLTGCATEWFLFKKFNWFSPLLWTGLLLASRIVAKFALPRFHKNRNYGIWLILLTSFIVAIIYAILRQDHLLFRFITANLALILIVPWMIQKRPR